MKKETPNDTMMEKTPQEASRTSPLLDREGQSRTKVLSNMIKQTQKRRWENEESLYPKFIPEEKQKYSKLLEQKRKEEDVEEDSS